MEYLAVDGEFKILETSLGVQRFADCPNEVMKEKDVRVGFPELIGVEDILIAILQGQQVSFELKGIGRFSEQDSPLYIDLYVIKNPSEENLEDRLIIFFEDVTTRMVLEQKLVQRANEVSLLLEAWAYSSDYLDKIITSMADAVLVTTPAGTIKTVNRAAKDLFGYSEKELIGKPISIIVSEENLLLEASQEYLLFEKLLNNVEVVCHTKSGEKVAIAFSCSAIQTNIEDVQDFIYVGRELAEH
jgi:PAS domain S-box-containing protein